jgi:hypothetical protein
MESSGFYRRVLLGTICRLAIRPIRFVIGASSGLWTRLQQKLAEDLRDRGKLDLSESVTEASFSGRKKGRRCRLYNTRQKQQNHGNASDAD